MLSTDNGRLLGGNTAAAVRTGMAAASDVAALFKNAHLASTPAPGGPSLQVEDFETALSDLRFEAGGHNAQQRVWDAGVGFPYENTPDLSHQTLYHVTKLQYLHSLLDRTTALRTRVSLPVGTPPRDPVQFLDEWTALDPEERRFALAAPLGRPLIWMTNQRGVNVACSYAAAHGIPLADAYCYTLGLGHHPRGEWLVRLDVPGALVQATGHYRPLFCDAVSHRYFMARSSHARAVETAWGRTANLGELHNATYDGAPERVSKQLVPGTGVSTFQLTVELLGEVTRAAPPSNCAPPLLADGVWSRRRN